MRAWSRKLGLRTWDKPAAACLASRVPYGTPVTVGTLRSVEPRRVGLRALGFRQLRVRHYGTWPASRSPSDGPGTDARHRRDGDAPPVHVGLPHVTLDLEGFRLGQPQRGLRAHAGGPINDPGRG